MNTFSSGPGHIKYIYQFTVLIVLATLSFSSLAKYGSQRSKLGNHWESVPVDPSGVDPFPLDSFSACSFKAGRGGYIFGGGSDNLSFPSLPPFAEFTNNLYRWKIRKHPLRIKFELVDTKGMLPSPRGFPEIACNRSKVYLYGGVDENFTTVQDPFWEFNVRKSSWTNRSSETGSPGVISGVSLSLFGNHLYLFGGIFSDTSTFTFSTRSDYWKFHTRSKTWTRLAPTGDLPVAKHFSKAGLVNARRLPGIQFLTFGGEEFDQATFGFPINNKVHLFSPLNKTVTQKSDGPLQNYEAFACNMNRCLVSGGDVSGSLCGDSPQLVTDQNWLYEVATDQWKEINSFVQNPPPASKRSRGVWSQGFFYKMGGFDIECDSNGATQKGTAVFKVYRLKMKR